MHRVWVNIEKLAADIDADASLFAESPFWSQSWACFLSFGNLDFAESIQYFGRAIRSLSISQTNPCYTSRNSLDDSCLKQIRCGNREDF